MRTIAAPNKNIHSLNQFLFISMWVFVVARLTQQSGLFSKLRFTKLLKNRYCPLAFMMLYDGCWKENEFTVLDSKQKFSLSCGHILSHFTSLCRTRPNVVLEMLDAPSEYY